MRNMDRHLLTNRAVPVLEAVLPEKIFQDLFPVSTDPLSEWGAAAPSVGTLIALENGQMVLLTYDRHAQCLLLEKPACALTHAFIAAVLEEIPRLESHIVWRADKVPPRHSLDLL